MSDRSQHVYRDIGGWISGPSMTLEEMQLEELRRMWATRYSIEVSDGVWRATRHGNSLMTFTADSAEELRGIVYQDFIRWSKEAVKHNAEPTESEGCST